MLAEGGARRGNPLSAPPCCHRRGGLFRPPSKEPVDRPPVRAYQRSDWSDPKLREHKSSAAAVYAYARFDRIAWEEIGGAAD
jgi:hypothetical protein